MPVYSISRATQYDTIAEIQNKSNQQNVHFDGYDAHGFATNFVATASIICPTTNRLFDYSNPATPVANLVWYPYGMSLACCGGKIYYNEDGTGGLSYRAGLTYFKLYNSDGGFLMGNNSTALTNSPSSIILINGSGVGAAQTWSLTNPILATTKTFNTSRNTLTITGNTTYYAGVSNPTTSTSFWMAFAKKAVSGQNVYYDSSTTATSGTSLTTLESSGRSMMGFITYNNAPVQPTNVVLSNTATGISVTCRGNETNSISQDGNGAISKILFFYSTTQNGTYYYLGEGDSFTRNIFSSPTYTYTASISGGLEQGVSYYFKVATVNDVCIRYEIDHPGSLAASAQSAIQDSPTKFGTGGFVNVYDGANWNPASIYIYNGSSWVLRSSVFGKSDGAGGWTYN